MDDEPKLPPSPQQVDDMRAENERLKRWQQEALALLREWQRGVQIEFRLTNPLREQIDKFLEAKP